ncbi:MAG: ABC transporter permease [Actinobacteria bacterium]|nr:ABC transporter permease [Actinomycetota bacterium]MBW3651661.1 ABC transporter permease [Actinomycetota bacterium]
MTLRRGESVLLALGIPVLLLGFFSTVEVLPSTAGDEPVAFLFPGILALAVMSTAMVSLAIATGFERQYGVLKRLGTTPLGRPRLLLAKTMAVVAIEVLQLVVLLAEAWLLGYRPTGTHILAAAVAIVVATMAFAGIGMLLAGTLPALTTLAAANGLYLVLLLLSGMLIPLEELPPGLAGVARLLPSGALAEALRAALAGSVVPTRAWLVLAVWAVLAPTLAAARFRWE